ncbi:MAG: hypothetical protein ACREQZ_07575 [Woeseiaceae bacterium]
MKSFLAGLLLALCALATAQDDGGSRDTAVDPAEASERDRLEPAVDTASLATAPAADLRRRESTNGVMDELQLGRSEITGNQELPKVLYIVPWQKSDPGDLTGKPVNTLLDEVLAPIDRTEFLRQVDYYDELYGGDLRENPQAE